jgi:HAD superfamily hydrolase (TIGR01509 family)
MIGLRLTESSKVVKAAYDLETSATDLANQEQVYMSQIMAQGIPTMLGLKRLITELERRQIPWAVATSSQRAYAIEVLGRLNLLEKSRGIAAGDEVEQGKPEPDVYLLAAKRLDIDPLSCMALEDSVPGVNAALAAGMLAVAIPDGETSSMDFQRADFAYDSLLEVLANLDELLGHNSPE